MTQDHTESRIEGQQYTGLALDSSQKTQPREKTEKTLRTGSRRKYGERRREREAKEDQRRFYCGAATWR